MVPFLAAAAMLAGSALATAQDSHPNDAIASERALGAPAYAPGETVYRLIDEPSEVTTGSSVEVETPMVGPATDGLTYSFGSTRLCTTTEFHSGLC
jgi:hypothetical protein